VHVSGVVHEAQGLGEQLGDVDEADGQALPAAGAGDVEGAAAVVDDDGVGVCGPDAGDLVGDEGGADVGELDGEGAAEAAALVHFFEGDVVDAFDGFDEVDGDVGGEVEASAVAGIVVSNSAGRAGVKGGQVGLEDGGYKLSNFKGFGDDVAGTGEVGGIVGEELFVVVADHGGAGGAG